MITVTGRLKVGAVMRKVDVNLYNAQDVGTMLGITSVAAITAAHKAGVGVKEAGSLFFTEEDIEVLKVRPGRGRPVGSVKVAPMPEVQVEPLDVDEGNQFYGEENLIDLGGAETEEEEAKEPVAA